MNTAVLGNFENYEERIFSAYHYYSLSKKLNNTYRIVLKLEKDIDGDILKDAVKNTMERYPYLLIMRKNTFRETLLVHNPAPVTVLHSSEPIELGCRESNNHMIAFSYDENKIYINGFHGLTDGVGMGNIMKTLLYYYCREAYDGSISSAGVRVVGDEISEGEYLDPFPRKVPKEYKSLVKRPLFKRTFHISDDKRIKMDGKYRCRVKIDESELMKFCRVNDGSPAVLISLVLARSIKKLNPDAKYPVTAGIALNLRPAFNAPLAHHSLTDIIPLEFSEKIQAKSFDVQNTAFRSLVFLKSEPETVVKNLEFAGKTFGIMQKIPSLAVKRLVFGATVPSQFAANTFMLSYTGKADFGDATKYVTSMRIDVDSPDIGITVELSAIHGQFFIDIQTDFSNDLYLRAFCDELKELGIPYECGDIRPQITPRCTY